NGFAAGSRSDAMVVLKNGNSGFGSSNPLDRLHVVGNIRMVDGNQGVGRLLVSDANGRASWTDPGTIGSLNSWRLDGNTGSSSATDFLGTTDAQGLAIR